MCFIYMYVNMKCVHISYDINIESKKPSKEY